MTLNELIHVEHLQWCLAHSRHSENVSYLGNQFEVKNVKNPVVSNKKKQPDNWFLKI